MKITVLGCGSAFTMKNYNQSFLLEENGKKMLIDCGRNIPEALLKFSIDIESIDSVYISHAHSDHIGGLEFLAFKKYNWIDKPRSTYLTDNPINLIANELLLKNLWEKSLKGGLETMEGFVANLETFFKPKPIQPNDFFIWEGWKVVLVQQIHNMSGSIISPVFGLFFEKKGHKSIYFTIDAQYFQPKQVIYFYDKADIIFQDCEVVGVNMKDRQFIFGTGVHASYAELAGFPTANAPILSVDIRRKMWLSHYQDCVLKNEDFFGNKCNWKEMAGIDSFAGFLIPGYEFFSN